MEPLAERKRQATLGKYREVPEFPKEIFLDLTSFCNHACVFCANPLIKNKTTMEEEMVYRVLTEAYECGVTDLGLYATGESFLVRKLANYVGFAKNLGYRYLFITTNGALATPDRAKPVIDAGLDSLKFSISAGTKNTYKQIQGRDDFDLVLENLRWISRYREESQCDLKIYVTMVYTDKTRSEVEKLEELVRPFIDEWDPHELTNQCGNMPENNAIGSVGTENPRGRGQRRVCYQPFKGFTVTPEGTVSACVIDYSRDLVVGDLNQSTLTEIWEGEVYKKFRRRHLNRDLKGLICHNCMNNAHESVDPLMPEYKHDYRDRNKESTVAVAADREEIYFDEISEMNHGSD